MVKTAPMPQSPYDRIGSFGSHLLMLCTLTHFRFNGNGCVYESCCVPEITTHQSQAKHNQVGTQWWQHAG